LSGEQNLLFFSRLQGLTDERARTRIKELLAMFELTDLGPRRFHEYSTGNRQRLAMARALLTDPPVLVLDEPTRSLDPIAADGLRRHILDWASAAGEKTVLITSHNLAEVEQLCGRVAVLSQGALKECATLDNLRTKYARQETVVIHARLKEEFNGLGELRSMSEGLRVDLLTGGHATIRFTRDSEDGLLTVVLEHLLQSGAQIVGCYTSRLGLKEVMEAIENQSSVTSNQSSVTSHQ
jgi:ABC-2 type transport system ATP-binding protein